MPLIHSSSKQAFVKNLKTELAHDKPRDQALAIAYRIKRERRARGGPAATPRPLYRKPGAASAPGVHAGPINSAVPGRTDKHALNVAPGSYVIPSETISHLGQNNTNAGMNVLQKMFGSEGPYGIGKTPSIKRGAGVPKPPRMAKTVTTKRKSHGGEAGNGEPVEILAAGGEYIVEPAIVAEIGGGDVERGHEILDHWIMTMRKDHIKTLRKLPRPAKS